MSDNVLLLEHLQELFCHEEAYQESIVSASPLPRLAIQAAAAQNFGCGSDRVTVQTFSSSLCVKHAFCQHFVAPLALPRG
jgi:hypothetical protein